MSTLERAKEGTRQEGTRRGRKGPVRIAVRVVLALILLATVVGIVGFLRFAEAEGRFDETVTRLNAFVASVSGH